VEAARRTSGVKEKAGTAVRARHLIEFGPSLTARSASTDHGVVPGSLCVAAVMGWTPNEVKPACPRANVVGHRRP